MNNEYVMPLCFISVGLLILSPILYAEKLDYLILFFMTIGAAYIMGFNRGEKK